jgi:hypothetical protein
MAAKAATSPFALGLLAVVLAAGVFARAPLSLSLVLGGLVYAIAAGRDLIGGSAGSRPIPPAALWREAFARTRTAGRSAEPLSLEIRAEISALRERQDQIRRAIESMETPYQEVGDEVDGLVDETTQRALRLDRRLWDMSEAVRASELAEFTSQMERLCMEMDTVRANLRSSSGVTDSASHRLLALQVRSLRTSS